MNYFRKVFVTLILASLACSAISQDVRALKTKVADLLARMPAESREMTSKLMEEMYSLGDEGTTMICQQVVPAGTGDDTRARYAVSSLTYHLSLADDKTRKEVWEQQCIKFLYRNTDPEVKSYFMNQLSLIGSEASVTAAGSLLGDSLLCGQAVLVLEAIGSPGAQGRLAEALEEEQCHCPAQIMIALGGQRYSKAVQSYIRWYDKGGSAEKGAALYALANSAVNEALPVLAKAAEAAGYRWEPSGAVQSLLLYAKRRGLEGDVKSMEKITRTVISKSNTPGLSNQRLAAVSIIVAVKGPAALPLLLKSVDDPDIAFRGGIVRLAALIPGSEATKRWIAQYGKVSPEAKQDILFMLGERHDEAATALITREMDNPSGEISMEAVTALPKITGKDAVDPLLAWICRSASEEGHWNAANALTTILDSSNTDRVAHFLGTSQGHSAITLLYLLSWSGDKRYFDAVMRYHNSEDTGVRAAALNALKRVAGFDDREEILRVLAVTAEKAEITELQNAVIAASLKSDKPEKRTELIINAMDGQGLKEKLIPVLASLGGEKALERVAAEFDKGDAMMREICFDALSHWSDHTSAGVLSRICASGNKTYGRAAFEAYLRQTAASTLTPERKLLMIKQIASCALSPDAKTEMVTLAGTLRIYPALFFLAQYLNDEAEEVRLAAGEAISKMNLPDGDKFVSLFNGKDLTGWKGLAGNPLTRAAMKPAELATRQKEADVKMLQNWSVKDGMIVFNGEGSNICTVKEYGDIELFVDWRITKKGDSGIYLRGTPQVQIWDTSRTEVGAQVGSGGLYNNKINPSAPLRVADNPVGEWNNFHIIMTGDRVSVWLNGELVTDNVIMENYWDRSIPLFEKGAVELQAHGTDLAFRDIMIREIPSTEYNLTAGEKAEGFVSLFNGRDLNGWTGNKVSYGVEDAMIVIRPGETSGGNLYTEKEYSDFVFRFEFQLTPGANNGLGIRTPLTGDAAYVGMEIQILDNTAPIYADLYPWQYHGSVYGVITALRGFLKPVGEWNTEEVMVKGTKIRVTLNNTVIVDGDIAEASENGTLDGKDHPGLLNSKGHIGFLGHGSVVRFRNIRIREL